MMPGSHTARPYQNIRPSSVAIAKHTVTRSHCPNSSAVGLFSRMRPFSVAGVSGIPHQHATIRDGLAVLRPGTTLINTARGELIDQEALVERMGKGDLFAILDVTTPWTLPPDHPFYDDPNVLLTPHSAGSLGVELTRLAAAAADEVERIADGRPPAHPVDAASLSITA